MTRFSSTNRPLIVLVGWFLALCLICPVTACHTDHPSQAPTSQAPAAPNRQSPSPLPPAKSRTSASDLLRLSHAIERVDRRTAAFGLRDSRHQSMEALKIIPYSQGYLGVYHHSMRRSFEVRVATSTNLRVWHYWSAL